MAFHRWESIGRKTPSWEHPPCHKAICRFRLLTKSGLKGNAVSWMLFIVCSPSCKCLHYNYQKFLFPSSYALSSLFNEHNTNRHNRLITNDIGLAFDHLTKSHFLICGLCQQPTPYSGFRLMMMFRGGTSSLEEAIDHGEGCEAICTRVSPSKASFCIHRSETPPCPPKLSQCSTVIEPPDTIY